LTRMYITYTTRQETWCAFSTRLQKKARACYGSDFPDDLRERYRALNRPLLKYYNALTTNTRMLVLYASLIAGNILIFFAFEIVILNTIMALLLFVWQKRADRLIEDQIVQPETEPVSV